MLEKNYNSLTAYGNSKLANILHCKELSKRLEGMVCFCYSLISHTYAVWSYILYLFSGNEKTFNLLYVVQCCVQAMAVASSGGASVQTSIMGPDFFCM